MTVIKRLLEITEDKKDNKISGGSLQNLQSSKIFNKKSILDIVIHSIEEDRFRGKHYHSKKTEWFVPIQGKAKLKWYNIKNKNNGEFNLYGDLSVLKERKQKFYEIFEIEPDTCHKVFNESKEDFIMISLSSRDYEKNDNIHCKI